MPALPSSVLEPLWVQVVALLPTRHVSHPLGCHRPRIPDRLVFDKLIQVLVFGCGYRRIADGTCSATTLRRCRDEWIALGLAERLRLAVDGCITKAPCGGQSAGPSPVDRRKQGLKRSVAVEAAGIPLAALPAPANHRDDRLLVVTLDAIGVVRRLPEQPTVHLDAGYDYQPCRQVLAERGMAGEIAIRGRRHRSGWAAGGWSRGPTLGATSTASCAGVPSGAGRWWRSGWRWPVPSSSVAAWSAAPGPAIAGRVGLPAGHDHLAGAAGKPDHDPPGSPAELAHGPARAG